jgi:hypothetical protein
MHELKNWWQFTKERFDPISHMTMIILFLVVHVLLARSIFGLQISTLTVILLFIATTAFYFKLRLYDEIKDYEVDLIINKTRPLPRGLLKHADLYWGISICIILEAVIFASQGLASSLSILITIIYSLIMFKEFFIKEKIRPHLTTYAVLHTVVTSLLSIAIFSFLSREHFFSVIKTKECLYFAIANWMLFNIFEFGRKTFATCEERENVDSYSSLFGRGNAVLLVIFQSVWAHFLIFKIFNFHNYFLMWSHLLIFLCLIGVSFQYIKYNSKVSANRYRIMSSLYIILFYVTLTLTYFA